MVPHARTPFGVESFPVGPADGAKRLVAWPVVRVVVLAGLVLPVVLIVGPGPHSASPVLRPLCDRCQNGTPKPSVRHAPARGDGALGRRRGPVWSQGKVNLGLFTKLDCLCVASRVPTYLSCIDLVPVRTLLVALSGVRQSVPPRTPVLVLVQDIVQLFESKITVLEEKSGTVQSCPCFFQPETGGREREGGVGAGEQLDVTFESDKNVPRTN